MPVTFAFGRASYVPCREKRDMLLIRGSEPRCRDRGECDGKEGEVGSQGDRAALNHLTCLLVIGGEGDLVQGVPLLRACVGMIKVSGERKGEEV